MKEVNKREKEIIIAHYGEPVSVSLIGEGWHNRVFLINKNEVFRLTASRYSSRKMELYSQISKALNIGIARPVFKHIFISDEYSFCTYDYIDGCFDSLTDLTANSVKHLSNTLSQIHHHNFSHIFGVPNLFDTLQQELLLLKKMSFPTLKKEEICFIEKSYSDFLDSGISEKCLPTFTHGDLTTKNIITYNKEVKAIIDWDGIEYNDPIKDLSKLDKSLFLEVLKYYPDVEMLGAHCIDRYNFYAIRKKVFDMYYCLTQTALYDKYDKYLMQFRGAIK